MSYKDNNLNKDWRNRAGQRQTSVLVSHQFYSLCQQHHIKFTEALRVGISVMLAERGITDYDNRLNILRRIELLTNKLSEVSQKYYDLKDQYDKLKENENEKNMSKMQSTSN